MKQNLASRRSHAAQERMRIITKLADNTEGKYSTIAFPENYYNFLSYKFLFIVVLIPFQSSCC